MSESRQTIRLRLRTVRMRRILQKEKAPESSIILQCRKERWRFRTARITACSLRPGRMRQESSAMWRIWQMTGNCRSKTVRIQRILRQKTMSEELCALPLIIRVRKEMQTPLLQLEAVRTAAISQARPRTAISEAFLASTDL